MVTRLENLVLRIVPYYVGPLVLITMWAIFAWVPTELSLGVSQRIFYSHVPAATTAFAAFVFAGVASGVFLRTTSEDWERGAHAAVSVGLAFASINLVTGAIWATTAWGPMWWKAPDARILTFAILWLVFASYLILRALGRDNDMMPRFAAVLAIVGALNIPLIMMATRLWRSLHPQVINNPKGGIDDPRMLATLAMCFLASFSIAAWLWALRVRVLRLDDRTEMMLEGRYREGVVS